MVLVVSVFVVLTILSMNLRISQAKSHVTLLEQSIVDYHQQWMTQFSQVYNDEFEKEMRCKVFKKNLKFIENFNSMGNQSYTLGVNEFTDLTKDEFLATHTGLRSINVTSPSEVVAGSMSSTNWNVSNVLDNSKDWRKQCVVYECEIRFVIKLSNQYIWAGACWAFSAVAAVEGLSKIAHGNLISLSEQQLLDCNIGQNNGCKGGTVNAAFNYIIRNRGITSENEYPYQMKQGVCRSNARSVVKIRSFQKVPSNNERALLEAVSRQPVSVSFDANEDCFIHYSGGVYNPQHCGTSLNHGLTLVGYGTSPEGMKYWLAKNSWGQTWGEKGFIRIRRDVEWPQGICGLAQYASYPVV